MSVWRKEVFERDDYTCRSCGNRSKSNNYLRIEAHHIKPFATFPEVRFNVDNGMTLCKKCHDKEPKGKDIYLIN
jgi:predicted restriction endonuclease